MGRPKKPYEMAVLSGATRKNPQRFRKTIPKHAWPLGGPPGDFAEDEKAAWQEIAACAQPGVLMLSDRILVEIMAQLLTQYRQNSRQFPCGKYRVLATCFSKMGIPIK